MKRLTIKLDDNDYDDEDREYWREEIVVSKAGGGDPNHCARTFISFLTAAGFHRHAMRYLFEQALLDLDCRHTEWDEERQAAARPLSQEEDE